MGRRGNQRSKRRPGQTVDEVARKSAEKLEVFAFDQMEERLKKVTGLGRVSAVLREQLEDPGLVRRYCEEERFKDLKADNASSRSRALNALGIAVAVVHDAGMSMRRLDVDVVGRIKLKLLDDTGWTRDTAKTAFNEFVRFAEWVCKTFGLDNRVVLTAKAERFPRQTRNVFEVVRRQSLTPNQLDELRDLRARALKLAPNAMLERQYWRLLSVAPMVGLRPGEWLLLSIENVLLEQRALYVPSTDEARAIAERDGVDIPIEAKAKTGSRLVALTPFAFWVLREMVRFRVEEMDAGPTDRLLVVFTERHIVDPETGEHTGEVKYDGTQALTHAAFRVWLRALAHPRLPWQVERGALSFHHTAYYHRHTFASMFLFANPGGLDFLRDALGHRDIAMSLHYARRARQIDQLVTPAQRKFYGRLFFHPKADQVRTEMRTTIAHLEKLIPHLTGTIRRLEESLADERAEKAEMRRTLRVLQATVERLTAPDRMAHSA
jgi:integrase